MAVVRRKPQPIPAPAAAPQPAPPRGGRRLVYSAAETRQHLEQVEQLLVMGRAQRTVEQWAMDTLGVTRGRAKRIIARVYARQEEEDAQAVARRRGEQSRRVLNWIRQAAGRRDPADPTRWLEKPNYAAVARFEAIYAALHGTTQPQQIQLDVRVSESLVHVVAHLDADQVAEMLAEYQGNVALAEAYRRQNPTAGELNGSGQPH